MKLKFNPQLFVHRWYESIILVLLVSIAGLIIFNLFTTQNSYAESSKERGEAVIDIVKTIKEENEKQTVIINRQFQALCFLLVETSGTESLKRLDPPLEQQCLELADELRAAERMKQAEAEKQRQAEESKKETSTTESESATPANPSSPAPQATDPPKTPLQPEQSPRPILGIPLLDALLRMLGGN